MSGYLYMSGDLYMDAGLIWGEKGDEMKEQIFPNPVVVGVFDSLAESCHENAKKKGFYSDVIKLRDILDTFYVNAPTTVQEDEYIPLSKWLESTAEQAAIARMHSELSEWLETVRKNPGLLDEHCPEFLSVEIEAADIIIRVLDTCGNKGYRIGAAVLAKMEFNAGRPYKHGKNS